MLLCQYRDVFGRPGHGVHCWRLGPFAAVDLFLTLFLAIFIYVYFHLKNKQTILTIFLGLWIVGELLHALFCVPTAFWRWIRNQL